jgi:glycosyltransferase involved in cell wall biosynthesis
MNQPKISIIIPVHNDGEYLVRCLDSVVNQTLKEIEVICIDDASTDSSFQILNKYKETFPFIIIIKLNVNSSAFVARIEGVRKATGKYIMFLDGDDCLSSNACKKLYAISEKKKVDILNFSSKVINAGATKNTIIQMNKRLVPYYGRLKGYEIMDFSYIYHVINWNLWNKIFTNEVCKKAIENLDYGYFPKANDLVFFFAICSYAKSYLGLHTSPYYYYYYGAGSTGRKLIDLDNLERLAAKRNAAKYLQNYIEIRTINDEYRSIYQNLDTRFLDDVLSHWINHLPEDKLLEGYKIIRSYWDDDEIVNHIIRNHSKTYKKIVDFLKSQESLSKYMTISNNSNTDHIQYSKKSCKKPLELLQSKISKSLIIIRKYGLHVFLGFLRYRINM